LVAVVFAAAALQAQTSKPAIPEPQALEFFEKRVRPILVDNCFICHGEKKQKAGLRLDSRAALLKGSETGPVVTPGNPADSVLIRAIRQEGELKMPPKGKLPPEAIETLTTWIQLGAPWPENAAQEKGTVPKGSGDPIAEARKNHWAFQPVRKPALPVVQNEKLAQTPIDRFILAKLEAKDLKPAEPADRRTLIRRATFDLIGLPPTPEEVADFEADPSPDAFAKVIDRLLASPHYGERWARHWLDVARYADTKGYFFDQERRYPYAYTYRDYVIRAWNEDLPYDRFLVQQLAADCLPLGEDKRPLAAMGFLTLGRRFLNNTQDIIDDRIDVVTRGLLGLTVACARCHDHKFDPIPTRDYYSLYGVFASCIEPVDMPAIANPAPSDAYRGFEKELKTLEQEIADFRQLHGTELKGGNRKFREELRKKQNKVEQLKLTHPGSPPCAMVLVDASQPVQAHVLIRGNPNNPGEAVPRQFLAVLAGPERKPFTQGSGRLELARAIADPENPLTARVLVNRIWLHHFGAGLVRTPSDFGLRGEPPIHPELLDYLAATFMENGWSIKKMHRLIMLSRVYQQSSAEAPADREVDPDNRLLARMNRRRLEFEGLRDSLLAVGGRLDEACGGKPVELTSAPFSTRRSVYGFIERQNLPALFRTFDFASPDTTNPQRHSTTVPQQALFLMNSPFVVEQARHLIQRPDVSACRQPEQRISLLYHLLYGRAAEPDEVALGLHFLDTAARKGDSPFEERGTVPFSGSQEATREQAGKGLDAWEKYAQVLLLANEFVFVD
jgi:hypothetical protein